MVSASTQTEGKDARDQPLCNCSQTLDTSFSAFSDVTEISRAVPSEWAPSESEILTPIDDSEHTIIDDVPVLHNEHGERKFIVFEKCLDNLLSSCNVCGRLCKTEKRVIGTFLSVTRRCQCGETLQWSSQPMSGTLPVGNLVVSGAILFSGASITQSLNLLRHANISCFSQRTYHNIQQLYLVPAVERVWTSHQDALLARIKQEDRDVYVGGDARCCSPGHTAKYGSYSLLDLETNQILDIQLVQVNM